MEDRRFVITTVYRCIDCPFFSESYTCFKVGGHDGKKITNPSDPQRWHDVRRKVADFCPLQKVDIEGVAASLGIVLGEDDIFKAVSEFMRRMEQAVKNTLEDAIKEIAPRCPHRGSVVKTQIGGRTYNKKCPDCGIPLVARVNHADGKRFIDYCHPNMPLIVEGLEERLRLVNDLSANEKAVWRVIRDSQIHIDDISDQSGLAPYDVSAALVMLELKGMVQQSAGRMFVQAQKEIIKG